MVQPEDCTLISPIEEGQYRYRFFQDRDTLASEFQVHPHIADW